MHDDNHTVPRGDRATLLVIVGGLALAALIAGVASYLHALAVAEHADGHTAVAHCIPVLADLTFAASIANLYDAYRHGARGQDLPRMSLAALAISALVTLGANWAAGDPSQVPTWLVNVWPPVAFMLALESLLDFSRRRALRAAVRFTDDGFPCPHEIGMTRGDAVRTAFEHARDCLAEPVNYTELGTAFGIDRGTVRKLVLAELPARDVNPSPTGERAPAAPGVPGGLPSANGSGNHG